MQYTISINQQILAEWDNIDLIDAAIVEYIRFRVVKERRGLEYHDPGNGGDPYWWVDHRFLTEDMPLLRIGKEALRKRLRKLVKVGLLERYVKNIERNKRTGQFLRKACYRVHENYKIVEWWYEQLGSFAHEIRTQSGQEKSKPISQELLDTFLAKCPRPEITVPAVSTFDDRARNKMGKFVKLDDLDSADLPMEELTN